jgi:transcriptional regulator with XRE-family HTH domain
MPKRSEGLPEDYAAHQRALASAIGERIRTRRQQLHLSQEQVRAKMELDTVYISRARFSRLELGATLANAAEIIALANVLQISYHWLLGTHEQPE